MVDGVAAVVEGFHCDAISGEFARTHVVHLDRFQLWVDECAKLFGGLDIAAVKAIRARDGTEYIVEVTRV